MLSQVAQQLGRLFTTQGDSAEGARQGWNPDWAPLARGTLVGGYMCQEGVPFPSSYWDELKMTHGLTPALTHAVAQKGVIIFSSLGVASGAQKQQCPGPWIQPPSGTSRSIILIQAFQVNSLIHDACCRHLYSISGAGLVCSPPFSPLFCIFSLSTFSAWNRFRFCGTWSLWNLGSSLEKKKNIKLWIQNQEQSLGRGLGKWEGPKVCAS